MKPHKLVKKNKWKRKTTNKQKIQNKKDTNKNPTTLQQIQTKSRAPELHKEKRIFFQ